ncbi:hypothetical protein ACLOJK_001137 [Asimina triloba]
MNDSQTSPLLSGLDHQFQEQEKVKMQQNGGWRSAVYIIGVEVAERFAFFGISVNLIMYLTDVLHNSTASAAMVVNIWSGVSTILPILGAIIADSYLGRYLTILLSSLVYLLVCLNREIENRTLQGISLLTLSVATVIPLRYRELLFFMSLYVVAIGEGGHRPCVQSFGADQFSEGAEEEQKAKASFFNWWYLGIIAGGNMGILILSYIQDNVGWVILFATAAIAMVIALCVFLFGSRIYKQQGPSGCSPLAQFAKVIVATVRKWNLHPRKDDQDHEGGFMSVAEEVTPRTNQFRFLDKAAVRDEYDPPSCENSWRLCTQAQVEEAKQIMSLLPIWSGCLMFAVVLPQLGTLFIKQCSTMDRKITSSLALPPASQAVIVGLTVILSIPIYDRVVVPTMRGFTGIPSGITMLQRIGIGMVLSVTSMVIAALVENRRLRVAREHGPYDHPNAAVPMSCWWLIPQNVVLGLSDVLGVVGMQEFFYDQMPEGMRSIGAAAYLSILGVGSISSSVIISVIQTIRPEWLTNDINNSRLDYYYCLLAGLSILWLGFYISAAKYFVYK